MIDPRVPHSFCPDDQRYTLPGRQNRLYLLYSVYRLEPQNNLPTPVVSRCRLVLMPFSSSNSNARNSDGWASTYSDLGKAGGGGRREWRDGYTAGSGSREGESYTYIYARKATQFVSPPFTT